MKRFFVNTCGGRLCEVHCFTLRTIRNHECMVFRVYGTGWTRGGKPMIIVRYDNHTHSGGRYYLGPFGDLVAIPIRSYFPDWDMRRIYKLWEGI